VGEASDPSVPVLEKLKRDFPDLGSGRTAINDKVAKLVRMASEAKHEVLVINGGDVRAEPNYLHTVVAPPRNAKVRGVTCIYVSARDKTFTQHVQSSGMICDFFPGVFVERQLDGIKFAFGQTIVTTRTCLEAFGG
jgi:ceramide glucosyltransferase